MNFPVINKSTKNILIVVGAISIFLLCALLLFPSVREAILDFALKSIVRKDFQTSFWNIELLTLALNSIFIIFLALYFIYAKNPLPWRISDKRCVKIEIALMAFFVCATLLLSYINDAIWYDESMSVAIIRRSWSDITAIASKDVQMPLYYLILKSWSIVFGNSIFALKLASILPTTLTLLFVVRFLNREFSCRTAVVFLLCFLASDNVLHYSIELRTYGWAILFITGMAVASWYIFKTGKLKWWATFVVCAVGAAYSQHYVAMLAGIVYGCLFFFIAKYKPREIPKALLAALAAIALYTPILPSTINQFASASDNYWIGSTTFVRKFVDYVMILFSNGNNFLVYLTFTAFCAECIFFVQLKDKTRREVFAFACLAVILAFLTVNSLISVLFKPMFIGRYLVPSLGLLWLFGAIVFERIQNRRIKGFVCSSIIVLAMTCYSVRGYREYNENIGYNAFRQTVETKLTDNDVFVFAPDMDHIVGVVSTLYPENTYVIEKTVDNPDFPDIQMQSTSVFLFIKHPLDYQAYCADSVFRSRPAWILTYDALESNNFIPCELQDPVFCGDYKWSFYRFKMYRKD